MVAVAPSPSLLTSKLEFHPQAERKQNRTTPNPLLTVGLLKGYTAVGYCMQAHLKTSVWKAASISQLMFLKMGWGITHRHFLSCCFQFLFLLQKLDTGWWRSEATLLHYSNFHSAAFYSRHAQKILTDWSATVPSSQTAQGLQENTAAVLFRFSLKHPQYSTFLPHSWWLTKETHA